MVSEESLHTYLARLASAEPTPGGGSVAALVGALGAGLAAMVARFTQNRKQYAAVAEEVETRLQALEAWRTRLEGLVQRDVEVFAQVAAAYRLPQMTAAERAARSAAIQGGLQEAVEVLFAVADGCLQVLEHGLWLAQHGNVNLLSDAVMAVLLGEAALQGAVCTIQATLPTLKEKALQAAVARRLAAYQEAETYRSAARALLAPAP